jgi:hypothetical protein
MMPKSKNQSLMRIASIRIREIGSEATPIQDTRHFFKSLLDGKFVFSNLVFGEYFKASFR